jgi:VWFA-related protein
MNAKHCKAMTGLFAGVLNGLALLAAACPPAAQTSPGPIAPKPGAQIQKPPQDTIRVKVDLVGAAVVVHDAKGNLVLDLDKKDFRLSDNGVQQRIEDFEMGGAPVSLAIVIETSSRVEALLPAMRRTGILFTQTVLGANGDATVIGYDDEVQKLQEFTSDNDAIERAVTNLPRGTSGARLYDALSEAVGALRNRPASRRRVIIAMAEAVDEGSEAKLGAVLREAQLDNITIYSIGLSTTGAALRNPPRDTTAPSAIPPGTFGLPSAPGTVPTPSTGDSAGAADLGALAVWLVQHATAVVREHPLELATIATGGVYQSPRRDSAIEPAIDAIGSEIHAQYTLTYRPTGTDAAGYHEIKVQVDRRGVKVRSRPGYYPNAEANSN